MLTLLEKEAVYIRIISVSLVITASCASSFARDGQLPLFDEFSKLEIFVENYVDACIHEIEEAELIVDDTQFHESNDKTRRKKYKVITLIDSSQDQRYLKSQGFDNYISSFRINDEQISASNSWCESNIEMDENDYSSEHPTRAGPVKCA